MKPISSIAVASLLLVATAAFPSIANSQESKGEPPPTDSIAQKAIMSSSGSDKDAATSDSALAGIYRIGVGDVLDIRVLNSRSPRSTLYSVLEGGLIDYPAVGGPIVVAGLTTDEIQTIIIAELKRRAVAEGTRVSVGVRHYASHSVSITGLVNSPGTKYLRREAVPLYVIMAEARALSEAARIAIIRARSEIVLDLSEPSALNFLIKPGDLISVTTRPQQFYYIGGRINYPGQKTFVSGITLLQALLAAGGPTGKGGNIEISREDQEGRLSTTRFKLKEIKAGKIPDPRLQPGDRIDIVR